MVVVFVFTAAGQEETHLLAGKKVEARQNNPLFASFLFIFFSRGGGALYM